MNRVRSGAGLLVAVTAMLLALFRPAAGQLPDAVHDDIIVGNADAIRTESVAPASALDDTLDTVAARIAVEFANAVHTPAFAAPTAGLSMVLGQVATRIPVEFANGVRHLWLGTPPGALGANLDAAAARIVLESANANRGVTLAYPLPLVNDTIPPMIGQPTHSGAKITWMTSEFTRIMFRYGPRADQLTETITRSDYAKAHEVTLPGVTPGVTYFYQITATDLSGNQATSQIYQIAGELRLYLPAVRKG